MGSAAVEFGFCLPIFAHPGASFFRTPGYERLDAATTLQLGITADQLGYDSLWVADHLFLGRDDAILEGWTTLSALAGATSRARLGMIHMAHFLRHPSMTAKMAATLDQLSGGRLIHFVDGGNRAAEFEAYGLPWVEPVEARIEHLVEELQMTRALWTQDGPVDFDGEFYQLKRAVCQPKPIQDPHPPIWLGEPNPAMLDAVARYGDGWNSAPATVEEMGRRVAALRAACDAVGRDSGELTISLEMQILVAEDLVQLRDRLRYMIKLAAEQQPDQQVADDVAGFAAGNTDELPASLRRTSFVGTPDQIRSQIEPYVDLGVSHFMLWFLDAPHESGMRLFVDKVAPHWR